MNINVKIVAQTTMLMGICSVTSNTAQAISCWKGVCIVEQNDTLQQIAKEMEISAQAAAAQGIKLESSNDINVKQNLNAERTKVRIEAIQEKLRQPQPVAQEEELFWTSDADNDAEPLDYPEESDDMLWFSDNTSEPLDYQDEEEGEDMILTSNTSVSSRQPDYQEPEYQEPEYQDNTATQNLQKLNLSSQKTYTVAVGDSLFSVMRKTQVNWRVLARLNDLNPPYSLSVGQIINVN